MKKLILAAFILAAAAASLSGKENYKNVSLHLPTGEVSLIGYHYDLTGSKVYGAATPVSFTDKYFAFWVGSTEFSVSRTDKWYTEVPSESWTVYTVDATKNEDDAWLCFEIGF